MVQLAELGTLTLCLLTRQRVNGEKKKKIICNAVSELKKNIPCLVTMQKYGIISC